ncbi:4'-phosphopantetheinyl transferase superfamily protein [Patulibacter sp.]|uniref:4'-phosphopantetheinyl transferase family protein n=1 Tax=Patulibacter sp. TaxID=1912859 RepID=UPI00271ECAD7|nr:4'-phosphopantetheinyl transferase superfamily protein [Patulibacter sp.]MDO9407844.1 4'-phosphopantetheinyl transferase superfamily protein [Patulibacter sp.]
MVPPPRRGEVRLHLIPVTAASVAAAGRAADVLSAEEHEKAAALRRPVDRDLYLVAHVGLRRIVAAHLGAALGEVVLGAAPCPSCGGPHGRPLLPQAPGLHVSLSHAARLAAVALAADEVGVDVEPCDRPDADLQGLTSQLHPDERRLVAASGDRRAALLRCWVRKEAAMKARGLGLAEPLDAHSTAWPGDRGVTADGLHVLDVDAGPAHLGAVAVRAPGGATPTIVVTTSGSPPGQRAQP